MTRSPSRGTPPVLRAVLRFVLDACIWGAPMPGVVPPELIRQRYQRAPSRGDSHVTLSRAEQRQWKRLVKRLTRVAL